MVKIICISDTHTKHRELKVPNGDVLIHAGDIGGLSLDRIIDFNEWIGSLPHKYKIVIAGNHDEYVYNNPLATKRLLTNCIYLENEGYTISKLKLRLWGSPISPVFNDWFFMADRGDEISKYWDLIPKDLDILITHSPPIGILDKVNPTKESVGCWDLYRTILKQQPKLHVFGHIHEGAGVIENKLVTFVNASVMDENYEVVNKPVVINL